MLASLRTVCATTAVALVAAVAPLGTATAVETAPAAETKAVAKKNHAPLITFTISEDRTVVEGALTQPAGPLHLRVLAEDEDHLLSLFQFKPGYTVKQMRADTRALGRMYREGGAENAKAVKRMQRNTITYGGANASMGSMATAIVNLKPGNYFISDNVGPPGGHLYKLKIVPGKNPAALPDGVPVIKMTGDNEYKGASRLPATGTVEIVNAIRKGHEWLQAAFLEVQPGTTEEQVANLFRGTGDGGFVLSGYAGGDTLSPGNRQFLKYSVEPGTYALICFFPDPNNPGSTYVADGMVRIISMD
ncbi:hypothetical protein [Sporichthya polymorpha]|uniref:hypothetical protein n=1 Tax=Sporichthya polymorpha TaxID=35751 RepID=UPI001FE18B1C|nr:hypothetical protein [Sporichthya polymorpha]